jgi:hypothetical protein
MSQDDLDNADVLELLVLDGGADINAPAAGGDTPLLIAATLGYEEIVDFIVHVDDDDEADQMDLVDGFATPKQKRCVFVHPCLLPNVVMPDLAPGHALRFWPLLNALLLS